MKYKAIIFDLDGTLVHTVPEYRYDIVGRTLNELGSSASEHHIDRFWFEARRDNIIKKHFGIAPEAFWKTYRKHDLKELREKNTKPYNDIDFLQELRQKGFKLGIVTGAPPHIAALEIDMIGEHNFDAIIIARDNEGEIRAKPDSHGLHECLKILNARESEALFVGNADEDVLAAQKAGIFDILLDRKEHSFPDINPSLVISSLYELRKIL